MKKYYLLLLFFAILGGFSSVKSQSIQITTAFDSTSFHCLPNARSYYYVATQLSGYTTGDSVRYKIYFGDGTFETDKSPIYGTTIQSSQGYVIHNYSLPGTYTVTVVATAPDGKKDSLVSPTPMVVSVCGNIVGKAYVDQNSDCIFNTGDGELPHALVAITDNATSKVYYAMSDINGNYEAKVPVSATYSVNLNYSYLTVACPTAGHTSVTAPSTGIDLGVQCGSGFDVFGAAYGRGFRPARQLGFWVKPFNGSCNPTSGTISVVLSDPRISFFPSSFTPAPTVNGDTITWPFTNIDYTSFSTNSYSSNRYFQVLTDTSAKIGDSICFEVIVTPFSGDNNTSNNVTTYCFPVSNSFDPNEKNAQPLGYGDDHIIAPGTRIDYTVHFQNTGNAVAYDVFILDTLDDNLDVNTISFNGSSHNMDWEIFKDNIIRFNFKNINLPDSNSNEPESHGYASFSITPKSGTALDTKIENSAAIYFDFNEPIITNTVERTIGIITGVNEKLSKNETVKLYPNPTEGLLNVELNEADQSVLTIYSILGQPVESKNLRRGKNILDLSSLPTGIYLLQFTTNGKTEVKRVIVE